MDWLDWHAALALLAEEATGSRSRADQYAEEEQYQSTVQALKKARNGAG